MGFKALATSSSAAALTLGLTDHQITLEQSLLHLQAIVAATALPINADFENAFADEPERVAENVLRAAATGAAGISVEDQQGETESLYDEALAVERIRAAKQALRGGAPDVMLVARTEAYLVGRRDPKWVIERLLRFAEAGADCLFAPGVVDVATIADIVRAVAPVPVNVLMYQPQQRVAELEQAGVRRVSIGGSLARASWQAFDAAARSFLTQGTLAP
jgi:2-methylisocitrate lyase-like PEP mutase family enzyme